MQVTELKNDDLNFEAKVVIPSSKIADKIQKELATLSQKVKIDGFRPGKVPTNVIKKKYKTSVRFDVIEHEINHVIKHIIKDHKLKTVGDPKLEDLRNEENADLEFTVKFELLPNIDLPDFKKIVITKPKLDIKEKEVNEQIEKLATISKNFSKENTGKAKKDDQVTIDAIGYIEDKAFEGGKVTDYKLVLGSKSFIDNFEDQLVGSKAGDEVEVNVTFPEDYHVKDLAGKPSKFIVQVKAVHSAEEAEINYEFAKKFNCETLDELRANISKRMAEELDEPIQTVMKISLFDQLEKILTFNAPKSLVTQEVDILKSQTDKNDDSDSVFKNKSEEEKNEYFEKLALRRVRVGLLLAEYMKIKDLRIEQDDIRNAIMSQARRFPGQEMAIFDYYQKNPKALEHLKGPLLEEKTIKYLFDNEVTLEEKIYNRKELEEFLEQEEDRVI
ncbi:MAG: trigger factor [Candidatus Rickettsia vulgarisii]